MTTRRGTLIRRVLILAVVMAVAMFGGLVFADVESDSSSLIRVTGLDGANYIQIAVDPDEEAAVIQAVYDGQTLSVTEVAEDGIVVGEQPEDSDVPDSYVLLAVAGADGVNVYVHEVTPGLPTVDVYIDGEHEVNFAVASTFDITTSGSVKDALAGVGDDVASLEDGLGTASQRATAALILVLVIGLALIMWLESKGSGDQPRTALEDEISGVEYEGRG